VELLYRLPARGSGSFFGPVSSLGLRPYREDGRRYSTVRLRAPKTFQERTLWPEFLELSKERHAHLDEPTERVIREAIDEDVSEAAETGPPKALPQAR
jgi:hypothetical protein